MKNWNNIKNEIRKAEEPVSPQAWSQMEAELGSRRRGGLIWFVGFSMFAVAISGMVILQEGVLEQKAYYQPRELDRSIGNESIDGSEIQEKENALIKAYEVGNGTRYFSSETQETQVNILAADQKESNPISVSSKVPAQKGEQYGFMVLEGKNEASRERMLLKPVNLEKLKLNWSYKRICINPGTIGLVSPRDLPKTTQKTESTKLEVRFFMAPTYNMPSLEYSQDVASTHKQFDEATNDALKPGWGIDAGFELRYRVYKNFRISSGFTYREIVTQNNYDFEINEIPVIDGATGKILGYIPSSQPQRVQESSSNLYSFLNIPLSLYYEKPLRGPWVLTGEAINNISFLVNQSAYGIDPTSLEVESTEDGGFNKTISSYQFRLGLRYKVTENFYLAIEPAYRKAYQDFIKDESVSWKPEDFSISLTGIVKLK